MKVYKKMVVAGLTMFSAIALAACSNDNSDVKSGFKPSVKMADSYNNTSKSSSTYNNGTLKVAEYNSAPFAGITSPTMQNNAEDGDVYSPGNVSLFNVDNNNKIIDGGLANLKLDKKAMTATITINSKAKWSNGSKVIARDVEYPYEIIGAPDSPSQQYTQDMNAIKGMAEYHAGKAKTISGITMPKGEKGNVVVIHYSKFAPSLQYIGNSYMWSSIEPYEHIKNVPISKLASSSEVRKNPIFAGPYKLSKQVTGESTLWVPNKYYYGKQAQIKHITIQVVNPNNFTSSLKAKQYDFAKNGGVNTQYPQVKQLKDYKEVGTMGTSYDLLGFNVGHFDSKKQENVMDSNMKMGNVKLRQAMMYALDIGALRKKFDNGLSWLPNSVISPYYKKYYNSKTPRYTLNISKANKLLDEAGYKKKGKWRVQPNGKPLVINFGAQTGTSASEAQDSYYLQQWHKIGLNVQYAGGRPMEMNKLYSILLKPKQDQVDIFEAGFSTGSEPTQTAFYGASSGFNIGHFSTAKNNEFLNDMNNEKSWDDKYRQKQFKEWQTYLQEQAVYVPVSMSLSWTPVNTRVKGYSARNDDNEYWSNLQLTASNPE